MKGYVSVIILVVFSIVAGPAAGGDITVITLGKKATGDAVAVDVLEGKTFSNHDASGITGTMANNGSISITPGAEERTIPEGFHDGAGTIVGDSNLISTNIKEGKTIFGIVGILKTAWGCRFNESRNWWEWTEAACIEDCTGPSPAECSNFCSGLNANDIIYFFNHQFCGGTY